MQSEPGEQTVSIDGETMGLHALAERYRALGTELAETRDDLRRARRTLRRDKVLKPFQAELLKLQKHLEIENKRMIVLFEGRDAAGKGGTIRRVTRYMNEKHYRVVALGKPTEENRTEWYFQRYVAEFPHGGEIVLFDRSWYNRAMVEPVFGFCSDSEYEHFMKGVVGFEKDLVRQGTILIKLYFSVTKEEQARRFERRRDDPLRQWKLSEIDVQAQEHWEDFTREEVRHAAPYLHRRRALDHRPIGQQAEGPPQRHEGHPQLGALRRAGSRHGLRPRSRDRRLRRPGDLPDGSRADPEGALHHVTLTEREFVRLVDHTLLKAEATEADVVAIADEGRRLGTASVCVNGSWVSTVASVLAGTDTVPCAVVGFPLGAMVGKAKAVEAAFAVEHGAAEVDMVLNVGLLRSGRLVDTEADIAAVRRAIDPSTRLKVILETALLTAEEIREACQIAEWAEADFVKTSTGFHAAGARPSRPSL